MWRVAQFAGALLLAFGVSAANAGLAGAVVKAAEEAAVAAKAAKAAEEAAAAAKAAKAAEEAAQAANAGKAVEGAGAGGAAVTGLKIENTAGKLGGTEVTAEANGVKVENSFGGSGGEGSRESDPPTWFTVLIGLAIVGWIVSKFRS